MDKWIKGNRPINIKAAYWIAVKSPEATSYTVPLPCQYLEGNDRWMCLSSSVYTPDMVVAYCEISMPKPYETIGTGSGYYIRAVYRGQESIYGYRLEPANWVGCGYQTIEKAKAALKRLVKIDKENNYDREVYEVVDGVGKVIWNWNGGVSKNENN